MLKLVDDLIEKVLVDGWRPPGGMPKASFTIPDEAWQTTVQSGEKIRLNIYLYEVSENRNFRRAEWDNVELPDGSVALSQPPTYLDCHYLISAWSPAKDPDTSGEPTQLEHEVLAEAMRVLLANPDVVPAALGISNGPVFKNAHVYLTVAPPEPPRISNDFWSTMKLPWRPAIMLVVIAPLDVLRDSPPSPVVTTLIQRFAIGSATVEEFIAIGGLVLKAADQSPIAGALVARLDSGDTATTDARGRYVLTGIQRGVHPFRASAAGMTPLQRNIDVPADSPATHVFQLAP